MTYHAAIALAATAAAERTGLARPDDASLLAEAFDGMRAGVSMWSGENRLLLANRRFYEIFDIDRTQAPPGVSFGDFQAITACGGTPDGCPPDLAGVRAPAGPSTYDDELPDGRVIAIERRPIESGGWVATYEDVTERQKALAQVAFMAQHDALTKLVNRELFHERLQESLVRGRPLSLLCIDLDRFKQINDTMGHPAGDALLRLAAARLSTCFRQGDVVARLGGDEFACILTGVRRRDQAFHTATRIIALLSQPFEIAGRLVTVGASVGIALAPMDGNEAESILLNADLALYQAKADGRGVARFYEQAMGDRQRERAALEADMQEAIERNELALYYQPLISTKTGRVTSFEALMRWKHPVRGFISPGEFIPLAEACGMIVRMGAWALRRACNDAMQWPAHIKVAVNLSTAQFANGDLVRDVQEALCFAGLSPHRLTLEVTESVLIKDADQALSLLTALRELGVRIAMDDFGTGYSSLSYIRDFSFDKIKIDQSFVANLGRQPTDDAVVRAVLRLAQDLGIETVGEGVETATQRDILTRESCTDLQGYLFSRPVPLAEVAALLHRIDAGQQVDPVPAPAALYPGSRLGESQGCGSTVSTGTDPLE